MNNDTKYESVLCNYCSSDKYRVRYIKDKFNYVECIKCGLVFVNPRLTQNEINHLYDENYFRGKGFDRSIEYKKEFEEKSGKIDLTDWDISTIRELLQTNSEMPKLLDAGCGMGLFLWKAKQKGFDVEGLELSSYASEFVKSKGIGVQNKSIYEAKLTPNSYDAIVMKEVIEHLPDPMKALQINHKALKPGGVLFITTGNYNCPERKLRGKDWFYFMPAGHIYIFSNRTIKQYLKKTGFTKIIATNQGDLLMNFALRNNLIETDRFMPKHQIKNILLKTIRGVNHFISSGMRVYAVK